MKYQRVQIHTRWMEWEIMDRTRVGNIMLQQFSCTDVINLYKKTSYVSDPLLFLFLLNLTSLESHQSTIKKWQTEKEGREKQEKQERNEHIRNPANLLSLSCLNQQLQCKFPRDGKQHVLLSLWAQGKCEVCLLTGHREAWQSYHLHKTQAFDHQERTAHSAPGWRELDINC